MFSSDFWSSYFEDISIPVWQFILAIVLFIAALIAIVIIVEAVTKTKHEGRPHSATRDLTYGAVCLALSFALSYIPLYSMPYGGTVTPASILPLLIYCYYFGLRKSVPVASAYMVLQLIQGPYILSVWSALLDYFVPYTCIAVMGILSFKAEKFQLLSADEKPVKAHINFFIGVAIYFVIRYASHVLAGYLFWAGDLVGWAAWSYSLIYNASFLVPDTIIAIIAGIFVLNSRSFNTYMINKVYVSDNAAA